MLFFYLICNSKKNEKSIINWTIILSIITLSSQTDISKVLILFFSYPDENYNVLKRKIGNTKLV